MNEEGDSESQPTLPKRFQTARSTLLADRFMNRFITIGGISVIVVVLGIFLFILWQVIPLFLPAEVNQLDEVKIPDRQYRALGLDEYTELPFLVETNGALTFLDLKGNRGRFRKTPGFVETNAITALSYNQERQDLVYGTADGHFSVLELNYKPTFDDGDRTLHANLKPGPSYRVGRSNAPIRAIQYGTSGEERLVVALQSVNGSPEVHATRLIQKRSLFGAGEVSVAGRYNLTSEIDGRPTRLLIDGEASGLFVATASGTLYFFHRRGGQFHLRQTLTPFDDLEDPRIASMEFLLGDVSLVLTSETGHNRIFSLYIPPGKNERLLGQTKEFDRLQGPPDFFAVSLRNKAFMIGHGSHASLHYATTETTRWEQTLPYKITRSRISPKYNRIVLLDQQNQLHILRLDDPHPQAGWKAFFGKIWYEGQSKPQYKWQSTGGSDEFEPKLSLVPLIAGTFKGTFYAMIFAVPIALLAAIYTSQFALPKIRAAVKPVMEIMASLPSVVLGFLAALWLAPLIETRIPSVLLMIALIPLTALLFGLLWSTTPIHIRSWIRPGYEILVFTPILLAILYFAWEAGPWVERQLFVVTDPETGSRIADFRLWWPRVTGADFDQRNALIVGFAMGFAVIPIIFTITEDSLSNVPAELRSGSLALGASRWQTTMRVILPTASAGVFSALMIGLGRAVGETMIVVMATGNTPIMDFNIFTGMRTLSANIAVELPEAPYQGTLYRALFMGALVLFILTFLINTIAEILRQRLREKYRLV